MASFFPKNPADLGIWSALWNAFCGVPTDFYPRVKEGDEPIRTLSTEEILIEFGPGVTDGLDRLLDARCLVLIVTESAQAKVAAATERLGLKDHFTRIIEGKKRPELFERVARLAQASAHPFMIGDKLDRDIAPAKAAGLTTIYFPSGFKPRWMPDEGEVRPDFRIESFAQVPGIVFDGLAKNTLHQQAG